MTNTTEHTEFQDNPNQHLMVALRRAANNNDAQIASWISTNDSNLVADLLDTIVDIPAAEIANSELLEAIFTQLMYATRSGRERIDETSIVKCYKHLEADHRSAHKLLALLSVQQTTADLRALADAIVESPP